MLDLEEIANEVADVTYDSVKGKISDMFEVSCFNIVLINFNKHTSKINLSMKQTNSLDIKLTGLRIWHHLIKSCLLSVSLTPTTDNAEGLSQ